MFKYFTITLLVVGFCGGAIVRPTNSPNVEVLSSQAKSDFWTKWGPGIMEFLELMDLEKLVGVFMQYLGDPEVLRFLDFIFSQKFKDVVWEFESMAEFKEAFEYLAAKGYDVESVMDFINSSLGIPPLYKPRNLLRKGKGMSGFIEAIIATLPLTEIRDLFQTKLETNQELAELFDTINSEEFMDIMKRMSHDPKFTEIKGIFEGYGFDLKLLCSLAKEIFGDYYQGIFCQ